MTSTEPNKPKPPVDPTPLIRQMDNIMSVDIFPNGDEPPLVFYSSMGKRYLVEVVVRDITDDPFYAQRGLKERLIAWRAAKAAKAGTAKKPRA